MAYRLRGVAGLTDAAATKPRISGSVKPFQEVSSPTTLLIFINLISSIPGGSSLRGQSDQVLTEKEAVGFLAA